MTRNSMSDLNNHLFAQLERLGDEDMDASQLEEEIKRSKAIAGVSKEIIDNARLGFDVAKLRKEYPNSKNLELPEFAQ